MLEDRKIKEIEHYNKKSENLYREKFFGEFQAPKFQELESFRFLYKILKERCRHKVVLDYGCGNGIHSFYLSKIGAKKVIGIDLSEKSLEIARERLKREKLKEKIAFLKMDCEKMEFPDNYFDIVFDGGTFSSLDLKQAIPELFRVLKPTGFLIGIETFGHNPFTNLKRKINRIIGKRTSWEVKHIFRFEDFRLIKRYFSEIEVYYFHLISWLVFPFLNLPGGKLLLKLLGFFDNLFLKIPFLRKYAFKVVFVLSKSKI